MAKDLDLLGLYILQPLHYQYLIEGGIGVYLYRSSTESHFRVASEMCCGEAGINKHWLEWPRSALVAMSDILHFAHIPYAVRMQSMSITYAVQKQHSSFCFHTGRVCSLMLIHSCLQQTQHLSIILISNPHVVTENAFSALWSSFITLQ